MEITERIELHNQEIAHAIKKIDNLNLKLGTSNKLLTSFLDSFDEIFLRDPSIYSDEEMYDYITARRFLGQPGIVDKVQEHLNKLPV